MRKRYLLSAMLAFGALGAPATGAVVSYQIAGTGSGSLGGAIFTDAAYNILITGDTTTIASCSVFDVCEDVSPTTAVVTIAGLGSVAITHSTRVGVDRDNNAIFFGYGPGGADLLDFSITETEESAFNFQAGYGPISSSTLFALNQFHDIDTNGGLLSLGESGAITFLSFVPSAVPEPGTWAMILLGFGAIGCVMRRRRTTALA